MLTVSWSLYDEFFGLRPWRKYQAEFSSAYSNYLDKEYKQRRADEQKFYATPQYVKLTADIKAATDAARAQDQEIGRQIDLLDQQRAAMTDSFTTSRGLVGSLTYQLEQIDEKDKSGKESKLKELNEAKAQTFDVAWPVEGGKIEQQKFNYDKLNGLFVSIMQSKAKLVAERGDVDQPAKDAQDKLNAYVKEQLPGLAAKDLFTLSQSMKNMDVHIRQINVNPTGTSLNNLGGAGLVDRCQSCHLGTDLLIVPVTMTLTKADLGQAKSNDAPFGSHPDPDMMKYHPLEKFGCSPCHGGNGRALDTVEKGHGRYEHWLWPLYYKENFNAGCQQCHASDAITEHAPVLNRAKQLYRERGCIGCHKFQGFDNQDDQLIATRQQILQLGNDKQADQLDIPRLNKLGDSASSNADAQKFYAQATNLTVTVSNIDSNVEQLEQRTHNLQEEIKKVGPDLKEVRMKLHKEWVPYWLANTHVFRPNTKM